MRNKILLIGLVCAAPLVLGTLAYYLHWDVGAPSNHGELLPPKELFGPPFVPRLRGKWVLVAFDVAIVDLLVQRDEEPRTRAEVLVRDRLGRACFFGEHAERERVGAALAHERKRRLEQLLAAFRFAQSSRVGGGFLT